MRKRLEQYWRSSITALLCAICACSIAQIDTSYISLEQSVKEIKHWDFDLDLLPAQSIYGRSWSAEHVDSPAYNYEQMKWGYLLDLIEENCEYVHPIQSHVTSHYGWRRGRWHKGIDIELDIGDPVVAAFDGVVRIQRYNAGGFGSYVMIRHYNGLETLYAHLSEAIVVRNQTVRAGQIIGFGGSTGRSTGPHLHFQTMLMGQAFDPRKIIDFDNYSLLGNQAYINHTWFPYIKGNNTRANTTPANAKKYHKVRRGDTLYGLARRYGTTVNTICKLNRISRNTPIRVGRNLRVK